MPHRTTRRLTTLEGAVDAVLALVLALSLILDLANTMSRHGDRHQAGVTVWLLTAGSALVPVAVVAATLARRRWPVGSVGVVLVLSGLAELVTWRIASFGQPGVAACLAVLLVCVGAVRDLRPRAAVVTALCAGLVAVGTLGRYREFLESGRPNAFTLPKVMVVGWLVAVALGLGLRVAKARRRAALEAVRHEQRLDLARELHDTAAHQLTAVVVQAQAARIGRRQESPDAGVAFADIEAAAAQALASLRQVIGLLRDPQEGVSLAPQPDGLGHLVARFTAVHGIPVKLELPEEKWDPSEDIWPPEVATTVLRVAQEALTNVARHATGATEVTVSIHQEPAAIRVDITDDGLGTVVASRGGYGLVGMRERVQALGGTFAAGPRPGGGWAVRAAVPTTSRPSTGLA